MEMEESDVFQKVFTDANFGFKIKLFLLKHMDKVVKKKVGWNNYRDTTYENKQ